MMRDRLKLSSRNSIEQLMTSYRRLRHALHPMRLRDAIIAVH